jgi:hypothetical protein
MEIMEIKNSVLRLTDEVSKLLDYCGSAVDFIARRGSFRVSAMQRAGEGRWP